MLSVFKDRPNLLTTKRLDIAPLTRQETEAYLIDVDEFAQNLGLSESPKEPESEERAAFNWLLEYGLRLSGEQAVWGAVWGIVERETRRFIGCVAFKGDPIDEEIEIAYAIDEPFRGRGFMTEALGAFVVWGKTRKDVRAIVAETLKNNIASQRVLEANGFARGEDSPEFDAWFWRRALL